MEYGTLYIVGTPIGNLEDITLRAARILSEVDLIAAEDTRHSLKLLNHLQLHKPLFSYHEHNRAHAGEQLLHRLEEGTNIALVTDAGMPVISDPGFELVRDARAHGFPIQVVPGPCAVSSALALSGMDGSRYLFMGFIPRSGSERAEALRSISVSQSTVILYEAPHRLADTLKDLAAQQPKRMISVCHDLTKLHESVLYLPLSEAYEYYTANPPKGEFVLVLEGASPDENNISPEKADEMLRELLKNGTRCKDAARNIAAATGLGKNELYRRALEISEELDNEE